MDFDAEANQFIEELPDAILRELGPERAEQLATENPDELRRIVSDVVSGTIEESGHQLAGLLVAAGPEMLARRRAEAREFERRLARRWAKAFGLAEMAMRVSYELGEQFNDKHQARAERENDLVFAVLVRLHARACRISEEVLSLLKAGFGQAALSRWRALHEVAVVASFIGEHGQETANRYLLHEYIETWRAMEEMDAKAHRLNETPPSQDEMEAAKDRFDELVTEYGRSYAGPYGWAQEALEAHDSKFAKKRVGIPDLEATAKLDHLRPYYRMASHGTHANPKGILFTPDLIEREPEVLLAGPASTGLADPGQCTLISLQQVTATLVMHKSGESAGLVFTALRDITNAAADAYVETQFQVEDTNRNPSGDRLAKLRLWLVPKVAVARVRIRRRLAGRGPEVGAQ